MGLISYSGSFNRDSPTTTEVYQIDAGQAVLIARLLLGGMQWLNGGLVYIQPATDYRTGLVCTGVEFATDYQATGASTLANSDGARLTDLTVTYGIPDMDEDNQSGSTELGAASVSLGGSMLSLKKTAYTWQGGSKDGEELDDDDTNRFKVTPEGTVSVTVNNKPTLNLSALSGYFGKVNSSSFYMPGINTAISTGYCRFDGASANRKFSTDGYPFYEVTYTFAVSSHNWNYMFSEEDSDYYEVSPAIYETANLNLIWSL